MAKLTYAEASRQAIAEEMRRDASVWAVGEDLGRGGVFGQYKGLQQQFGPSRIIDTPISEAAIMGAAVGMALVGRKPVVEMRFSDFALCAIDELINQAAKARYMFGGQGRVPLVVREPIGMWRSSAAQHSQSLEGWYTENWSWRWIEWQNCVALPLMFACIWYGVPREQPNPGLMRDLDWPGLVYFTLFALVCFVFGYWWFARTRKNFADVI
jgi:pyruvate/2-oxoglutarate/acetoin dehydrogenase E1 component